jgi:SAM-dependent methyltransferase
VLFREAGYAARQCGCGLLYASPQPPAGLVDPAADMHPHAYYALPARLRLDYLRRCRPSGRLLEVGCGVGHFLAAAQQAGYEVAGIEVNPARAETARARLQAPVETGLFEDSDWPERSCDIVYHCDLLSHFADPPASLRKMTALLRPGGLLYFEVGVVAGLAPGWYPLMGTLGMPTHRWFYTVEALERLLERCGLRVLRLKRFGLAPAVLLSQLGRAVRVGGGATAGVGDARAARRRPENPLRLKLRTAMRYRLGPMVAGFGPETAFVIAAPG